MWEQSQQVTAVLLRFEGGWAIPILEDNVASGVEEHELFGGMNAQKVVFEPCLFQETELTLQSW
ncbi:hypothetical protein PG994_001792 [Apiospora phragmitis]|uniref:Uncharacterized protein n=1 Tax=Apiospora phragmitis TaxID=2905665 RepID=A0ABR1WUM9_9PEZI